MCLQQLFINKLPENCTADELAHYLHVDLHLSKEDFKIIKFFINKVPDNSDPSKFNYLSKGHAIVYMNTKYQAFKIA